MKMKKYEELELRDDFMFSRIMSNPKFVKPLLETILGVKIRKIVYPQTQKTIDLSLQAKGIRLAEMWSCIQWQTIPDRRGYTTRRYHITDTCKYST